MTDPYVVEWIKQTALMNTPEDDWYSTIAADSDGLYVTYRTDGTVSGGVQSGAFVSSDIVVMRMNKDGSVAWIKQTALMNTDGDDITQASPLIRMDYTLHIIRTALFRVAYSLVLFSVVTTSLLCE
jgi:hypothetical protein